MLSAPYALYKQCSQEKTMSKFIDKRGSDHSILLNWEVFVDMSYFDCICVRLVSDRDFNSNTSFHFITDEQANSFVELLKIAH